MDQLLIEPCRNSELPHGDRDDKEEKIDRAAVYKDGTVYSLPRPARHHSVLQAMDAAGIEQRGSEQGFVTTAGRWARRKPALFIARAAGQIVRETAPAHGLFSEDVW